MDKFKRAKILDYAAGFFLVIWIAMIFFRLTRGENFFFWLGAVSFVLFILLFRQYDKTVRSPDPPPPPVKLTPEEMRRISFEAEENSRQIKEFQTLIHKIAESKNIEIKFLHGEGTGHMDFPEQWKIEKPIPLTPEELYELTFFEKFVLISVAPQDGVIYARRFYFEDGGRTEYSV